MSILSGVRIIDLTQGLTGPYCTQLAADMGAEVIKVEPLTGDYARRWGPPFERGESVTFLSLNRNKRSVALDIAHAEAMQVFRRLLDSADVLVEELLPSRAAELDLTYERNAARNPHLIQCHLDYWGEDGPRRDEPGAELPVQAMLDYPGGFGAIGDPPVRVGCDLGSMNTAVFGFQGIMAALIERDDTGRGQRVALSVAGSLAFLKSFILAAPSDPDEWWGFHLDSWVKPREHGYRTSDGAIYLNTRNSRAIDGDGFAQLLGELGVEGALGDPRFANSGREAAGSGRYAHEVASVWEKGLQHLTSAEAVEILRRYGAEGFEHTTYETIIEHAQTEALGAVREVPHPDGGAFRTVGNPWVFDGGAERTEAAAPPRLGADTQLVLSELGVGELAVAGLRRSQAIL